MYYYGIYVEGLYLEYHSAVPLSELGPPIPSPASECVPPETNGEGGGNTRLRVRERADPIWTTGEKAWHSV
jgi:hypothetical protein